jgi:hypothetical protein
MRGGHGRSGPPPDPNALRRDRDGSDWIDLPAAGRAGDPPAWPLSRRTKRELAVWEGEWKRPQAVIWEARSQELEVALYVRAVVVSERPRASAADRAVVLRFMEDLGLSQSGLARNRWRIVDGTARPEPRRPRGAGDVVDIRERLKKAAQGG